MLELNSEVNGLRCDLRMNGAPDPDEEHRMVLCIMEEDRDRYKEGHLRELYKRYEFFFKSVDEIHQLFIFTGAKYWFQ